MPPTRSFSVRLLAQYSTEESPTHMTHIMHAWGLSFLSRRSGPRSRSQGWVSHSNISGYTPGRGMSGVGPAQHTEGKEIPSSDEVFSSLRVPILGPKCSP